MIAFGESGEDTSNPLTLRSTEKLRCISLKSYTEFPVGNAVGESVVQEYHSLWSHPNENDAVEGRRLYTRNVKVGGTRTKVPCKVIILSADEDSSAEEDSTSEDDPGAEVCRGHRVNFVSLKATKWSSFIVGWLPLALTIAVIVSCWYCKLWLVAGLILFGTLGMIVTVMVLRHVCRFIYTKPWLGDKPSKAEELILVVDDNDPHVLQIVKAKVSTIQRLFQRQIVFRTYSGKKYLFLAASMLYIYILLSVLCMSNVDTSGQIHFAIADLIGFAADMAKSFQDGKLGLARNPVKKFGIRKVREVEFGNRPAAVAFVAAHAKDSGMLKTTNLLPSDGTTWQSWWETLAKRNEAQNERKKKAKMSVTASAESGRPHAENFAVEQPWRVSLSGSAGVDAENAFADAQNGPDTALDTLLRDMDDGFQAMPI